LDISQVIAGLKAERETLDSAIRALENLDGAGSRGSRTTIASGFGRTVSEHRDRRTMSVAGRRRIAAAQRARWAKLKGKKAGATKSATTGTAGGTRHVSAAARRKMAAAQKARWAKVRAAKK